MTTARDLLTTWLLRQAAEPGRVWLERTLDGLAAGAGDKELYIALGLAPRRLGRADLALSAADLEQANATRQSWDPQGLSLDQAARILILLVAGGEDAAFAERFRQLCRTADLAEAIAFYRGLPLYPAPERLEAQAAEGTRSNMRAIFEAVAHRNPYPGEQFAQNRWNHMVLKALFVGSTLHPIQGLDQRANPELAAMLKDYAHERWAAGRPVSPELWRCIGPFAAEADALGDLQRVLASGSAPEREAATLALSACLDPRAKELLDAAPELEAAIRSGALSWERLAAAQ